MPPSGQVEATRKQLIENAKLINLPDRRFLERMQPQARQEIRYGLSTSCGGVDLRLTVLASGVMSIESSMAHSFIENGRMVISSDPETVVWSDTGEVAMIPTSLGRRHLMEDVTPELVVNAFLSAFGVHTSAAGDHDYSYWHRAMEIYAGVISVQLDTAVEIIHHLPLMTPYAVDPGGKSPLEAEATCHIYSIDEDDNLDEQIQYRSSVMKIQDTFQPEAMELALHLPTTVVRRQHRAMFQASPDGRSIEEHIADFKAHMTHSSGIRQTA